MRLKTKLVVAATSLTFAIVLVLSVLFLAELLRQRIQETAVANSVVAREVYLMTRQAVEDGLRANPPLVGTDEALQAAVADALRGSEALRDTMSGFVRYSAAVQDISVTDAHGWTLVSTDPQMWNQQAATRIGFERVRVGGFVGQVREVFGQPRVLDVSVPLERNGMPFLEIHVGVRSSFLKNSYVPWLKDAFLLALFCGLITMVAAGVLASLALRPIEQISRQLERLTSGTSADESGTIGTALDGEHPDAVVRVTNTIDRLGRQMRSTEAVYTDLQANLDQMLDTLRDGVVLFTAEWRAVMVSDAVANFVKHDGKPLVGRGLLEIFAEDTELGKAVVEAFQREENVSGETVRLEDGREVEITLDRIDEGRPDSGVGRGGRMGTLLTLRDRGSAQKLEQELDVSRRLAAVGRLTAGVGHEVKNPINAMVVHLELLRSKLQVAGEGRSFLNGAMRHVDILAGEMERLDRVVQTLADFTRPMELHLAELDLSEVARAVVELTGAEMEEHGVRVETSLDRVPVRGDGEMLRQALLNLVLNGMQAMAETGQGSGNMLRILVRREQNTGVIEIADQGAGIPADLMPKIFDLYFTTKAKGSGIGLAMTYRIVQMHGGAVEVASESGRGAVFTIRLPAMTMAETRANLRIPVGREA